MRRAFARFMLTMMRPTVSLTWPVAVASAGVAAVFACCTRWWLIAPPTGPATVAMAFIGGAIVGALLSQTVRDGRARLPAEHAMATLLVGAIAGGGVTLALDPELTLAGIFSGVLVAALMLPVLNVAARFAHRALRSRARSLVGGVDRRGPWLATASSLAASSIAGALAAVTMNGRWLHRHPQLVTVPLFVGSVALGLAAVVLFLDVRVEKRLARAAQRHSQLRAGRDSSAVTSATLDVGVGTATWIDEALAAETYRSAAPDDVAIVGDIARAPHLMRAALRQSALVCAGTAGAFLLSVAACLAAR